MTHIYRILPNRNSKLLFKIFKKTVTTNFHGSMIAICQVTSKQDKEENFNCCSVLIQEAAKSNAKVIFLPEACDYMGRNTKEILALAEPLDGPTVSKYKNLAKKHKVWISLGGVHEKSTDDMVSNSHVIINEEGVIVGVYRKVHLFDVDIPEKRLSLKESSYVNKGMEIAQPVQTPVGKIGLGICYDLRFPAFAQKLARMGAEVLTYPSAFTTTTGPAHWEILLKARAIETQSYVIAAAQVGCHSEGRSSYGHSMVIDPWGRTVAECKTDESGILLTNLDLNYLAKVRRDMPIVNHLREDLYNSTGPFYKVAESPGKNHRFGSVLISDSIVFLKTHLTIAFVNRKCVLPGHVLVAPIRQIKKLDGLTEEEAADFFKVIRLVEKGMEKIHNSTSSTVSIQDGEHAGQTVFQVHAHVIPRKPDDFQENDMIYECLEGHEINPRIKTRTKEEMEEEATQLRKHFNHRP